MNSFILLLLVAGIQSLSPAMTRCVYGSVEFEKNNILYNIRNNMPQYNIATIREVFIQVLLCATGSRQSNSIIENDLYRVIYRVIFKNERDLTTIHKEFCNHGKSDGIKKCTDILGGKYPCSALMESFMKCGNDANYNDGL